MEHVKTRTWIGWVRSCGGRPGKLQNRLRRARAHALEFGTRGGSGCCAVRRFCGWAGSACLADGLHCFGLFD
ncbi:hypothetical protein TIFTF001_009700 [Ficus carica]|uniref:Uncharacterized protein n=1 Tax=Ficus carica TaxID=3494 RepID=A0AA87ZV48_FICCA|nr:hypothetical protein TIFTF001_009700 [Ficus carica]